MYDTNEPDRFTLRTILAVMVIAALVCLGGAIVVRAEGLPTYGVAGVTDVTPAYFRTGCYLRGHGQGSFVDHKADMSGVVVDGLAARDFGAGIGGGCDYVYQQLFVGLGADYTFQNPKFTAAIGPSTMTVPLGNEWSLWGRLGFLVNPKTGLYVLGGYTGAQDSSMKMTAPLTTTLEEKLGSRRGGVLGGGVEFLVTPLVTMNLEYRHNTYGDNTSGTAIIPMKLDTTNDVVRLGMSLRFQ
jgi:outer membrane immunogenic protein